MRIASFDVGLINLGIWVGEFVPGNKVFPFRFTHWEVLSLGTCQLKEACECMVREFERRPFLNECDWILVENQIDDGAIPGRRTAFYKVGRMKAVAQAIQTYFYTKRYQSETGAGCHQIVNISARNKLKVWTGLGHPAMTLPTSVTHTKAGKPKKISAHKRNKLLAEAHTPALLRGGMRAKECDQKWLAFFDKLKKQDDVADAFLQAAYWILRREQWNGFTGRPGGASAAGSEEEDDFW